MLNVSPRSSSRMLKKPASVVLASFRPSTPRVHFGPSPAAALLDELLEHPAGYSSVVHNL